MKIIGLVLAASTLAAALSACGGEVAGTAGPEAAPTPAGADAAADPEAEIESVFDGYYDALLARDFRTACQFNAPETTEQLLAGTKREGVDVSTCEEAFAKGFEAADTAETADEVAESAEVQSVTVTGDNATVTWSANIDGQRQTATVPLRRVDGEWKLVYVGG